MLRAVIGIRPEFFVVLFTMLLLRDHGVGLSRELNESTAPSRLSKSPGREVE